MLHGSPKQPNKKRRLDSQQDSLAGPSAEVMPLVSPHLVPKSSKDPNRGTYPKMKEKSKGKLGRFSCPTFNKASKLFKESSRSKNQESEDTDTDISLSDISIQEDSFQNKKPTNFNTHATTIAPSRKTSFTNVFSSKRTKAPKSKFSGNTLANKILNYFKPVQNFTSKVNKNDEVLKEIEAPSTSGYWKGSKTLESKTSELTSSEAKNESFFKKYSNCYGLLNDTSFDDEDERPNYFERLPVHVMETILCQIPMLDLLKCRLVCTSWNDVISDSKFMEWKKLYYGIRYDKPDSCDYMDGLCGSLGLSVVEDCFGVLIKFMADGFGRKPSMDMCDLLMKSSKSVDAELVIAERFPEVLAKESKAWCIFTTAMLLSETVWDVCDLYKCLFSSKSECSLHDITDAMYCTAAFLVYFRNVYGINHGLHYRVYYALYMIENNLPKENASGVQSLKIPKGLPGQQSIHSYSETSKSRLTYEQIRILNHCFQPEHVLKIVALAGTGKTTTLIHLARLYPQVKFLNVMFNKAVCEDAKKNFPPNVTCKTAHSLAFKVFGSQLRHKLSTKVRPHDLVTYLQHNKGSHMQIYSYAKNVLNTIEHFTSSAAKEFSIDLVPTTLQDTSGKIISETDREKLLKDSIQIWKMMIDRDNKSLRVTHDVYLKLYQLSEPRLSQYQCVMVDEAQDCNPAMIDIVLSQNLPVILVGDPNQQIYGFRGAHNALQSIEATHTYHLTKSFRFGAEIGYIASCVLEVLKFNTRETIVGNSKPCYVDGRTEGQYAIIARTNVQLFNEAVRLCCEKRRRNNEPSVIHGAFAGGIKGYGFDQILDIYKLKSNSPQGGFVTDKFISKFSSYIDLVNYAKSVEDNDLLAKIELVKQHGGLIQDYINIIKEKCSHPMELANVIFSTAHKAKGLEFDTVFLTDDYPIGRIPYPVTRGSVSSEETSILYVALTRAKKCLLLPEKLLKVLLVAQEKFEYPVASKKLMVDQEELKCAHCGDTFVPHTALLLVRRKIVMASGRVINGGPLCMKCGTEPTVRPQVHVETVVMYLDPTNDYAHRSMSSLVGPLPSDPPIVHNSFGVFNEMEIVYVINVNL